jgi:hypothetical protein
LMSVDDGPDYVTWHHSWQKKHVVSKGEQAGCKRGRPAGETGGGGERGQ